MSVLKKMQFAGRAIIGAGAADCQNDARTARALSR
jgi:hypothetical protein